MTRSTTLSIALRSGAAVAAIGAALSSAAAYAQAAPAATAVPASTGAPTDSPQDSQIIVTGSRLARPDLESSSPVNVVTAEQISLKAASANIENVLNDLPQVTATTSSTSNNPGGGVATVNLRGLGAQRTLVLVNGRRYISYDVNQIVDLNTVPSSLIERVDVVTGGASAVYGSDAISGVVNFVLKHNFSGVEANSSYTLTQRGDGQIFDSNVTIGSNFDDNRGNVTLYVDYLRRKPTFAGDRGFSYFALSDSQNGSPPFAAGGSPSVPQGRISVPGLGRALGLANTAANNVQTFNQDGTTRTYTPADGYNFSPVNYLQVPQKRFLVSGQAQYEINEHFTPYIEAQFVNNRVNNQLAATPISQGTPYLDGTINTVNGPLQLQVNSPFFAPSLQAALRTLDTDGNGYVSAPSWSFRSVQVGPRVNLDERNAFRVLGGMKGDLFYGFTYDGSWQYSRTKNTQRQDGNLAIDKFLDAVTTAFDANGNLVCRSGNTGCAPANIFGLNKLSQAAINYISVGATNIQQYTEQVGNFTVTNNNLFDLGAGGAGLAFGVEYRSENGSVTPDTFLASGDVAGFNPGKPTAGGYHVRDLFGELRVPLLRDKFIHRLELNGAVRQSKYSNAPGNVLTWAAGAELSPIKDITFRGNFQRAIRGPSVNELFLGNTVSFAGNADSCGTAAATQAGQLRNICLAQFAAAGANPALIGNGIIQDPNQVNPLTFVGGNPNLREEKAKTYTLGAVIQPSFVPRLSFTVDYYRIKLTNFIHTITTQTIGNECFQQFNQTFCNLIQRNASGEIDTFSAQNVNTGSLLNRGIDVTAGYAYPIGQVFGLGEGKLNFSFSGTRLLNFKVNQVSGDPSTTTECAGKFGRVACGVPTPKWRHSARVGAGVGPVDLSLQWRYIGKATDDNDDILYGSEKFSHQNYFDLTAQFEASDHFTFTAGVANMLDNKPPLAASGQNGGNGEQSNTYPTLYDVLGRSFFVSGKVRF